jgi:hypothetical protein
MKKILFIALVFVSVNAFSQERVAQWTGTVTTTNWISNKIVLTFTEGIGSVSVWDSTGGSVLVAFSSADTAAASNGLSRYATVASGATFNFPNRSTNTVFLKAVGTSATVYLVKY